MTKAWIQTLTLALALAGCSSSEGSDTDDSDPPSGKRDAGSSTKRDAAPTKEDADDVEDEAPPRDAGRTVDAATQAPKDASSTDAGSRGGKEPDPRCVRDSGPYAPGAIQADPSIVGDDWFATTDGIIFTTAGVIYNVPGKGDVVFGRQQLDSCVVTVAESGVMTTIYGGGTVCHNNQVVSLGIECQTDANGDPVKP